jgi:hypothetical protein
VERERVMALDTNSFLIVFAVAIAAMGLFIWIRYKKAS